MMLALIQTPPAPTTTGMPTVSLGGASPEAILVGAIVVTGLVLWISGTRMLKPAVVLTGVLVGALFGSTLAAGLKLPDLKGVPAPYAGLALGGLLGLGLALALFRLAVAGIAGVGLGLCAAVMAALFVGVGRPTGQPNGQPAEPDEHLARVREQLSSLSFEDFSQVRSKLADHVESRSTPTAEVVPASLRTISTELEDQLAARWANLGSEPRLAMLCGATLGVIFGGLYGLLSPRRGGAMVTAMIGAALWLGGAYWFTDRYAPTLAQSPWASWTLARPAAWAVLWIMLGLIGYAAQRSGEPKPQVAPAPAPAPKA